MTEIKAFDPEKLRKDVKAMLVVGRDERVANLSIYMTAIFQLKFYRNGNKIANLNK
jgi:hypothetical protein